MTRNSRVRGLLIMKTIKLIVIVFLLIAIPSSVWALRGVVASSADIQNLKNAVRSGIIKIGETRLNEIRDNYGEAESILDDERKMVYDYGEVRIDIEKKRIWKDWEYDTFRDPAYNDDIDDLRFDLESEELTGDNITYRRIRRDYGEPTEAYTTNEDGGISIFYYGDIKMIFENHYVVRSWKGSNLRQIKSEGVLQGKIPNESTTTPPSASGERSRKY